MKRSEVLIQGLIAGLIAYASVILFYLIVNLAAGRSPFYTPAALGSILFYGARDPSQIVIEPATVLAYNGVHLVVSLLIGTAGAFLAFETERHHGLWYLSLFVLIAGFVYGLVAVGALGAEIAHVVPWWSVVGANLTWVLGVGGYLGWMHRALLRELGRGEGTALEE
jgi:hypothetical protein